MLDDAISESNMSFGFAKLADGIVWHADIEITAIPKKRCLEKVMTILLIWMNNLKVTLQNNSDAKLNDQIRQINAVWRRRIFWLLPNN